MIVYHKEQVTHHLHDVGTHLHCNNWRIRASQVAREERHRHRQHSVLAPEANKTCGALVQRSKDCGKTSANPFQESVSCSDCWHWYYLGDCPSKESTKRIRSQNKRDIIDKGKSVIPCNKEGRCKRFWYHPSPWRYLYSIMTQCIIISPIIHHHAVNKTTKWDNKRGQHTKTLIMFSCWNMRYISTSRMASETASWSPGGHWIFLRA